MKNTFIAENATIKGNVIIGNNCSVYFNAVIRCEEGSITIKDNTNIQDGVIIHCNSSFPVTIGEGVTIGHGAIVHGAKIGDNSLIGMGSIILDGAVIGKNCLIGAGTLITENRMIEDGSLVYGNPFRVIRKLNEEEIESLKDSAMHYVSLIDKYKKEL